MGNRSVWLQRQPAVEHPYLPLFVMPPPILRMSGQPHHWLANPPMDQADVLLRFQPLAAAERPEFGTPVTIIVYKRLEFSVAHQRATDGKRRQLYLKTGGLLGIKGKVFGRVLLRLTGHANNPATGRDLHITADRLARSRPITFVIQSAG